MIVVKYIWIEFPYFVVGFGFFDIRLAVSIIEFLSRRVQFQLPKLN